MTFRPYQTYIFIFIGFVAFAAAAVGFSWVLIFKRTHIPLEPQPIDRPWTGIVQECLQNPGTDGFGSARISSHIVIENESAELPVACKFVLEDGAHLEIRNSTMHTRNLFITSSATNQPTRVSIFDSTMQGQAAGLHISLNTLGSHIAISNSTLDYVLSLGVVVGAGDNDTQANLLIVDSVLQSLDSQGEGVAIASTGQAEVQNNMFLTTNNANALLLAETCVAADNTGINIQCRTP